MDDLTYDELRDLLNVAELDNRQLRRLLAATVFADTEDADKAWIALKTEEDWRALA